MTIEESLKKLILERYGSVSEFTRRIDLPRTTIASVFSRGINNSSVTTIVKISKALGISADALAENKIVFYEDIIEDDVEHYSDNSKELNIVEVRDIIKDMRTRMMSADVVTVDGQLLSDENRQKVADIIDKSIDLVKTFV